MFKSTESSAELSPYLGFSSADNGSDLGEQASHALFLSRSPCSPHLLLQKVFKYVSIIYTYIFYIINLYIISIYIISFYIISIYIIFIYVYPLNCLVLPFRGLDLNAAAVGSELRSALDKCFLSTHSESH